MKLILDLHGVLVEDFPFDVYKERVIELISEKFDKKNDPPPERVFKKFQEEYETISCAMKDYGLKEDYLRLMDELPIRHKKDLELIYLMSLYKDDKYIATNTSKKNAVNTLRGIGFNLSMFNGIYTGDDVEDCKPSIEMYEKIRDGKDPKDFIVIGDRVSDLYPAQEMGMYGILGDKSFLKRWLRASI